MSTSLSHRERSNPPPRSKSCAACIKAKRRCDRESPRCARCAHREIVCEYPTSKTRRAGARRQVRGTAPCAQGGNDLVAVAVDFDVDVDAFVRIGSLPTTAGRALADGYEGSGELADAYPPRVDHDPFFGFGLSELDELDELDAIIDAASNMPPAGTSPPVPSSSSSSQLLRPPTFDVGAIAERMERNFAYAVEHIKQAPRKMLLEMSTPWCHNSLYKRAMPRTMQDALSACALYEVKNSTNAPIVIRCINNKVADLLRLALPTEPSDIFAHTQALMLYQIMRFFDGDIVARSSADATFSQLDDSSRLLSEHIDWSPDRSAQASGYSSSGGRPITMDPQTVTDFWYGWVFQESARRTYLIARFFLHIWRLLTGQAAVIGCHHIPTISREEESWTLSAHLWQARDPIEFAASWSDKKHYVVRRKAVLRTLADAKSEDLEDFGKMILTTAMGVSQAKVWLASIGSTL